jgi:glutamate/tyrosine decarboxylase-like PLP-dependent enzyme
MTKRSHRSSKKHVKRTGRPASNRQNAAKPISQPGVIESDAAGPIEEIQRSELPELMRFLQKFWQQHAAKAHEGPVGRHSIDRVLREVPLEALPVAPAPLTKLLESVQGLLQEHTVKTGHPLFLGYVTPSSLDIGALADSLAAIVNQNVAFAALSPLGTALEGSSIRWLGDIVGYPPTCGGILTSGGSEANLYGLAIARRQALGPSAASEGNYAEPRCRLRIYCSTQTHHSIDKAMMLLGLGTSSVVRIPTDDDHHILIDQLRAAIERDQASQDWQPMAIVGNAGTRLCCAFDDLRSLRQIADEYKLWFHVDAAYAGFLRLATPPPVGAGDMYLADSIILNPHKLLFVPLDCGAILVRDPSHLAACFGAEGEYLEMQKPAGMRDYANFGMQLGRPMRALKVWLTLKRFGSAVLGHEYTRLLGLARYLRDCILADQRFELLGPVSGTAVCFRWRGGQHSRDIFLNSLNTQIRQQIVRSGVAFIDEVELSKTRGFRVCMTNIRTNSCDLDKLLATIATIAGGDEKDDGQGGKPRDRGRSSGS